jgi:hypothetical protein
MRKHELPQFEVKDGEIIRIGWMTPFYREHSKQILDAISDETGIPPLVMKGDGEQYPIPTTGSVEIEGQTYQVLDYGDKILLNNKVAFIIPNKKVA